MSTEKHPLGTGKRKRDENAWWKEELEPRKRAKRAWYTNFGVNASTIEPTFDAKPLSDYYKNDHWYFLDGNLILIADNEIFRIHRERLAQWEGVFQDMFSLPQPEEVDKLDGVPFCHISLLSPLQVENVIGACYGQIPTDDPLEIEWRSFLTADACLRAGEVFATPHFIQLGSDILLKIFAPPELATDDSPYVHDPPRLDEILTIRATKLVVEHNILLAFPKAYYHCAQLPITKIFKGVVDSDGKRERLNKEDVARILMGREKLILARRYAFLRWVDSFAIDGKPRPPSKRCTLEPQKEGDICYHWAMRMHVNFNLSRQMELDTSALHILPENADDLISPYLCNMCRKCMIDSIRDREYQALLDLPTYFLLGEWDDLQEQRTAEEGEEEEDVTSDTTVEEG